MAEKSVVGIKQTSWKNVMDIQKNKDTNNCKIRTALIDVKRTSKQIRSVITFSVREANTFASNDVKQTSLEKRKMCDVIDGKCTVDYNIIRDL